MSLKLNRPKSGSISSSVDNESSYKLVMVGDSGVGKSCLLDKFLDDSSANNFISTIGVDIKTRETTINNRKIKVQVYNLTLQCLHPGSFENSFVRMRRSGTQEDNRDIDPSWPVVTGEPSESSSCLT